MRCPSLGKKKPLHEVAFFMLKLPHQDSNLKTVFKPVCYHYTMGHSSKSEAKITAQ